LHPAHLAYHARSREDVVIELLTRFTSQEDGADMIEYACIAGFLALSCFLAMEDISKSISNMFSTLSTGLVGILP
jgi:Flp pilus assembly pilin Flp